MTTVKFSDTNAGGQSPSAGAAAFAASRLGLRVFPTVPGIGTPALKAYGDIATADAEVIREWWTGEFAGYGYGIATGEESGVWVLDIDVKHGVNGFASLSRLAGMHHAFGAEGLSFALNTMVVTTPSGGAHLYFQWAPGVVNSVGRLGAGLDVRGRGGYVRGPGWGGYQVVPRGPEGVRLVARRAAPEWLVELCQKRKVDRDSEALTGERAGSSWAKFNASKTLRTLADTPVGAQNTALNKAAYKLGLSASMSASDAWDACQRTIIGMGAGDDMPAWRRTFESGWNAGVADRGRA